MLSPGTNIGRYVVKRRLAEGGMAEVYLAQAIGPEGFSKDVVIKVVRSFLASDQQFIDMFINEARLSSRLNHANVVQIFDFGKHDNSYYLAMEYVRGTSLFDLRRRCRERGVPFPPTLVAEIGAQVARGMHYAHTLSDKGRPLGIVHRDVTPHNVLLSFDGAVKLTDFGIAKASTTHTAPGVLKGKFAYMSPEQARGDVVDARTDIFALGVVLWEMLTGSRLFDGDSELAVLRSVAESYIAAPSRLNPDVPPELSEIVIKALTRELPGRFQSAFELERALANFVLRKANSVEDTSVSLFLQQLYRDEIEAEERQPQTPNATPAAQRGVVPQSMGLGFADTVNRSQEDGSQRSTVDSLPALQASVSSAKTEPRGAGKTDKLQPIGGRPEAKTDRLPPVTSSPKTDQLPALKSSSRPMLPLVVESTDVVQHPTDRRTDPQNQPVRDGDSVSGRVKVSDSMQVEMDRAATSQGPVDPTLVRQRQLDDEPSGPTISTDPERQQSRRGLVLLVGAILAVLAVGGSVLLFGQEPPSSDPEIVKITVTDPPKNEPVKPLEPVVEPRPTTTLDAGAVAALEPVGTKPEALVDAGAVAAGLVDAGQPIAGEPKLPPTVRMGTLSVKAIPFATLAIDGVKREVSGVQRLKVPLGKHKLVFTHPKRSETMEITVDGKSVPELVFNANQ